MVAAVTTMAGVDQDLLARARVAAQTVAPLAAAIEAGRRLPPEAVTALIEAGVFKLFVPRSLGGSEAEVTTLIAVIEELAHADGSTGWCAMVGASSSLVCGYLPEDVAGEIFAPADATMCGVFAPMGRAVPVDGGYRVSGRWAFASGCQHSAWRMGGALVEGQGPAARSMIFPAADTEVIDTWTVSGLCGTGSHDLAVEDVRVPAARSLSLMSEPLRAHGLSHAVSPFAVLAAGVAAVALGIGRAAIDELCNLAAVKQGGSKGRTIAQRELVQLAVAQAEAKVAAARAFLTAAAASALDEARSKGAASSEARVRLRLAACHATTESAAAVDLMYQAAGASSIYQRSPLQRHFRDIHVATQHLMVSPTTALQVGRLLLDVGSDLDRAML
jgi:alkylation response protein AidB-like acyl-CoA dehydrogenase